MKGILSFHPVDPGLFARVLTPLLTGRGADLDPHLDACVRLRANARRAARFAAALATLAEAAHPPELEPLLARGPARIRSPRDLFQGIRARLDRLEYRPDELSRVVVERIDPDLHLHGRPFLVTEGPAKAVADAVDRYVAAQGPSAVDNLALEQLGALDPLLVRVEPEEAVTTGSDLEYRSTVYRGLESLAGVARAAREGRPWLTGDGSRRPAEAIVRADLAHVAVEAHAQAVPCWIAHDVDGLATMCDRAGVARPSFLETAAPLFEDAVEIATMLRGTWDAEIDSPRDLGAYVRHDRTGELVEFLSLEGARIIRVAAQHGEGPLATAVLRKIRECATYAAKHGFGYLEASGVVPPGR